MQLLKLNSAQHAESIVFGAVDLPIRDGTERSLTGWFAFRADGAAAALDLDLTGDAVIRDEAVVKQLLGGDRTSTKTIVAVFSAASWELNVAAGGVGSMGSSDWVHARTARLRSHPGAVDICQSIGRGVGASAAQDADLPGGGPSGPIHTFNGALPVDFQKPFRLETDGAIADGMSIPPDGILWLYGTMYQSKKAEFTESCEAITPADAAKKGGSVLAMKDLLRLG